MVCASLPVLVIDRRCAVWYVTVMLQWNCLRYKRINLVGQQKHSLINQSITNSFTNWIWTRSFDSCFVMRILCDWCDVDLSSPFSGWPLLYMCWCSVQYWGRWIHKLRTSELPWPCLLLSGIGGYLFLLTTSWCLWRLSLPLQCKYRQHGAEYRVE